jgi:Asp-tRNA(Asn)/Glu-tRNA(Gln) amidotransferase A subunit family amidase
LVTVTTDLAQQGAELVEIDIEGLDDQLAVAQLVVHEFAEDLAQYLNAHPGAAVKSLAEITEKKLHHPVLKERFARALESEGRSATDYLERVANRERVKLRVLNAMATHSVDVLLHPSIRRPPERINEDQKGAGNCRLAAATGLPAISVPAGFTDDGLPVGVELFGREFDEAGLLRLAFAYEQATHHRRVPPTTPTLAHEMDIR